MKAELLSNIRKELTQVVYAPIAERQESLGKLSNWLDKICELEITELNRIFANGTKRTYLVECVGGLYLVEAQMELIAQMWAIKNGFEFISAKVADKKELEYMREQGSELYSTIS